jgi:hypothetical protein
MFAGPGLGDDSLEQCGAPGGIGLGSDERIALAKTVDELGDVGRVHRSVK